MAATSRYDRQLRVAGWGSQGEGRLEALRVLLVGIGGVGTRIAELLVRSGAGSLALLDGDAVSPTDLHRQSLYYPDDARSGAAKVEAALRELRRIEGRTRLAGSARPLTARNAAEELGREIDLVIDATDTLAARALINREAFLRGIPWIHTAAIASEYRCLAIVPAGSPCFACYVPKALPADAVPTCEVAGILPAAAAAAAALAMAEVHRYLTGAAAAEPGRRVLYRGDVLRASFVRSLLEPDPECPVCGPRALLDQREGQVVDGLQRLCGGDRWEAWLGISADLARRALAHHAAAGAPLERGMGFWRGRTPSESILLFDDNRVLYVGGEIAGADAGGRTHGDARREAVRGRLAAIFGGEALSSARVQ
ncbi:MAG: HesA/MoeB/ThiF family protein [Planctomycetes bacterium]|nr:HesA/MoeB/ThiF family protein [Planctomycetota bacterium]